MEGVYKELLCVLFMGDGIKHRPQHSFNNMYNWKRIWKKLEKVNSTKGYVTVISVEFSLGVTVVLTPPPPLPHKENPQHCMFLF
jgi:hypothetical protein